VLVCQQPTHKEWDSVENPGNNFCQIHSGRTFLEISAPGILSWSFHFLEIMFGIIFFAILSASTMG
jgi:hypothetical protein